MGGDGLGPTIPSTTGKKDHGSDHVNNTNRVIVILGNNKENKINGFSLNKICEIPRSQLAFQNCLLWERHTNNIRPEHTLWTEERDPYFAMDLTDQMSQKGWKLKGKMMCSCSEPCFKNLVRCVVSQHADFSNKLPCYKAATMSYKNNFGAAVVKSISIDRFSARAENKAED